MKKAGNLNNTNKYVIYSSNKSSRAKKIKKTNKLISKLSYTPIYTATSKRIKAS